MGVAQMVDQVTKAEVTKAEVPEAVWRSIVEGLVRKHGDGPEWPGVLVRIKEDFGEDAVEWALRVREVRGRIEGAAELAAALKAETEAKAVAAEAQRHRELEEIVGHPIDWDGQEVEGEFEEIDEEVEEEVLAQPAVPRAGLLVLNPKAPFDVAISFKENCCRVGGVQVMWRWSGKWWRWNGAFYEVEGDEVVRGRMYEFLQGAKKNGPDGQSVWFQPNMRGVTEVLDGLEHGLALGDGCAPPRWLDNGEDAREWVVFKNGMVNVRSGEFWEPTPLLWAVSGLDFDWWGDDAEAPRWEQFLEEVFPGDSQSQDFIEEWLGYCMTAETALQKGAMFIGPRRSGKSTICWVMERLVGKGGYAGLNIHDWVKTENSREVLIGKKVGVFPDVRLKPAKQYGSSWDVGGIDHKSTELLLQYTGEDRVSVGRKFIGPWEGVLSVRIVLVSNEVPNLNDGGGVLPSRFVKVRFAQSFYEKEDSRLKEKLEEELPGIAARCMAAYRRLSARGRFVQPASAEALEREVLAKSDGFAQMAMDCFEPDHEGVVVKAVARLKFEGWCQDHGRMDLFRTVPENKFGGKLMAVPGFERLGECRPMGPDGRQGRRCWVGLRIRPRES